MGGPFRYCLGVSVIRSSVESVGTAVAAAVSAIVLLAPGVSYLTTV